MFAALATGGIFLFGKTKYILVALKLTKMTPLISMLLTSATYSLFFGWPYAVGMVGLVFVHELGHAIVMRHYGVPFSPMVFIPFMGTCVAMKDQPKNVYDEAVIALGGPVLGSLGAVAVGLVGAVSGSQLLIALADFGLMLNLFNLLPIGQLDGGRIASALSPWINVAGLCGGVGLIYLGVIHNPLFYLIMLAGTYTTAMRFFGSTPIDPSYYQIPGHKKLGIGVAYLALVVTLLLGMAWNNKNRLTPQQLKQIADKNQGQLPESLDGYQDLVSENDFFGEREEESTEWGFYTPK